MIGPPTIGGKHRTVALWICECRGPIWVPIHPVVMPCAACPRCGRSLGVITKNDLAYAAADPAPGFRPRLTELAQCLN